MPEIIIRTAGDIYKLFKQCHEFQNNVDKMQKACKMQDEQAKQVYADMVNCIRQFREEFYGE